MTTAKKPRGRGNGRYPLPDEIGGWPVTALTMRVARTVTGAVTDRVARGETTPTEIAKRMGSRPHLVARMLAEPDRLNSLRHVVGLAAAAGLRLAVSVEPLDGGAS